MHSGKKGFTLIELLVVIAIISILSVIGMTQLASARERARDSQRRVDMSQMQHVLISWYDDHQQVYPLTETDISGVISIADHSTTKEPSDATGVFKTDGEFIPSYLADEVVDPLTALGGFHYHYSSNNTFVDGASDYVLYTKMEIGDFYYVLGPGGVISDIPDEKLNPPTCPGLANPVGDGGPSALCTPPS